MYCGKVKRDSAGLNFTTFDKDCRVPELGDKDKK